MSDKRAEAELRIREACDEGEHDAAATDAIETFGPEILGFLKARLRDETAAGDAFAIFCEDLWRGLAGFEWRCSLRVWAYTLARHAANRYGKLAHRQPGKNVPLSQIGSASKVIEQVRTATLAFLRTEVKSRMRHLREQLPLEDQTVLILRIDKQLSWRELAEVMAYDGEAPAEAELDKEAGRLRKRFQLAKERLRKLAIEEGLLGSKAAKTGPSE